MLIISKFKDFYDYAAAVGVDKSVVYRRETDLIELPGSIIRREDFSKQDYKWVKVDDKNHRIHLRILVVAGKPIPYYKTDADAKTDVKFSFDPRFYDTHEVTNWMGRARRVVSTDKLSSLLGLDSIPAQDWKNLTDRVGAPVFSLRIESASLGVTKMVIRTNPRLIDLRYNDIADAAQTHQEIMMWLASENNRDGDPATQSEQGSVAQHGLHPTHAFRKISSEK